MAVNHNPVKYQGGTALVEFAITFLIYLLLIFAIIEFGMLIFDATRLAEGTRTGARYAIVNDPACDIFGNGTGCDNGPLDCAIMNPATTNTTGVNIESCPIPAPANDSKCQMVELMDKLMLRYDADDAARYARTSILAGSGKVNIRYTCSDIGDSGLPNVVPIVTVSAESVEHRMLFFGIPITLPSFKTTRTGEDLYSN